MHTTKSMEETEAKMSETAAENWLGLSYFSVTGKGDRPYNEDASGHAAVGTLVTFVVSDGVGGQPGGDLASHAVVERIRQDAKALSREQMLSGYRAIEDEIRANQALNPRNVRMGATVAELRLDTARQLALWGHFGDTRVYWFREGGIKSVTQDHSVVMSLVAAGLISETDAASHPKKNVLLGAFGVAGDLEPEVLAEPVCIEDGDAFLLCTDGVWNSVTPCEITETLQLSPSVEHWVRAIEEKVKSSNLEDKDNYTMIAVWVTSSCDRTLQPS